MDGPSDRPSDTAAFKAALIAIEAAHASEVAALRERADASEQARLGAQTLADRLATQLAEASARTDAEITTLRDAVGGLRDTLARAETRAVHAERRATEADAEISAQTARTKEAETEAAEQRIAADQARAAAEEARQVAETRIAGLEAEATAKVAQARTDAERARGVAQEAVQAAETLQHAIEELRAGQGAMQDVHTRELAEQRSAADLRASRAEDRADALRRHVDELEVNLEAVRADAQKAEETAATLIQADVARKARGRLRRAWDGWRGR